MIDCCKTETHSKILKQSSLHCWQVIIAQINTLKSYIIPLNKELATSLFLAIKATASLEKHGTNCGNSYIHLYAYCLSLS